MVARMTGAVRWTDALRRLWEDGFTDCLECEPGTTLSGFVKKILADARVLSLNDGSET